MFGHESSPLKSLMETNVPRNESSLLWKFQLPCQDHLWLPWEDMVGILLLPCGDIVEQSTKWDGVYAIAECLQGRLDKYWGHHCYSLDPSMFVRRQPVNSQTVTPA